MISCIEFIPAYSEMFKFIEKKGGKQDVIEFWKYLSDKYLSGSLKKRAEKDGLKGCWDYWNKALNEEAADFEMTIDEDEGVFSISMFKCPSKALLLETEHIEPYKDYCEHCDWLYRLVLEPLGFIYDFDMKGCDKASCRVKIKKEVK